MSHEMSGSIVNNTAIASLEEMSTGWLKQNGLSEGETFWWFTYWYGYEFDAGFDCRYTQEEYTINQPVTSHIS